MYNYFLQNPVKINILKIEDNEIVIDYKIIFLGNIPENIKNNILNFDKLKSIPILKKYYGNLWNKKLELIEEKKGGDDIMTSEDFINFDDFNLDMLNTSLNDENILESEISILENKNINKNETFKIVYNTDIFIYPEDNIKILKEKIYLATKIQIYEQNLSLHNYDLFLNKYKYDITFDNIFKYNKIKNIPIDEYLYDNKDDIIINGYEFNYIYSFFKEYNKLEFDLLSLTEFIPNKQEIEVIINEKQQIDMIYYSFVIKYYPLISYEMFKIYITQYNDIQNIYPLIHLNYTNIKNKYENEKNIIENNNIDINKYSKFINDEFSISIVEKEIKINNIDSLNKINIRNLFDIIEIVKIENLNYIQANIIIDNKPISIMKTNNKSKKIEKYEFIENTLILNINIIYHKFNIEYNNNIQANLIIYNNGDIIIKVNFKNLYDIDNKKLNQLIINIINPIISKINEELKKMDTFIPNYTEYNNTTLNSIMNVYWNNELSSNGFNIIINKFKNLIQSGILSLKNENLINNEIEYSIYKGMLNFNKTSLEKYNNYTSNYFNYYTNGEINNLWNRIFRNSKTILLKNKINNLLINLTNITENELDFILEIIYSILFINKKLINDKKEKIDTSSLRYLKQIDPKLFIIKDPKTGKDIYSRKCQKQLQPIIVSKSFINKENEKSIIKFWNFTKNKDEYYYCPNKKFPFVKFLTNIHPNNYCVPCCKKKDMSKLTTDNKSKIIYNSCINNYMYKSNDKNEMSRYIMTYGKELEINRIMNLPNQLDKLINNNIEKNIEQYYLYGIQPKIVYILADIYNLKIDEFIKKITLFLKDNKNIFNSLLNGNIINYFIDLDELIIYMYNTFIHNKLLYNEFILWNELFIDISKYLNINTIIFEDNINIKTIIPKNTKYITDIFPENNIEYLILLHTYDILNNSLYYPIYLINPKKHYKNKEILQKIYTNNDKIIINVKQIFNFYISKNENIKNILDLNMINRFIEYNKKYSIINYYIFNEKCYGLLLKISNNYLYISIEKSNIDLNNENLEDKLNFNVIDITNYNLNINTLLDFIRDYNIFIYNLNNIKQNESIISIIKNNKYDLELLNNFEYSFIYIHNFLIYNENIIGVNCNNLNFYINPFISSNKVLSLIDNEIKNIDKELNSKNIDLQKIIIRCFKLWKDTNLYFNNMLYNPLDINSKILNPNINYKDNRLNNKNKSLYNSYLYILVLLQFQKEFLKYKNLEIRSIIKNTINNFDKNEFSTSLFRNINNKLYENIKKYFSNNYKNDNIFIDILIDSYNEIVRIILFYLNTNNENIQNIKKLIINEIDNNIFSFDKSYIIEFKSISKSELTKRLQNIAKNIFYIQDDKDISINEFPNILISCFSNNNSYCNKDKLIISKKNLDIYINILISDIYNPIKSQYIFSSFFIDNNINNFIFKSNPNEKIFII